MNQGITELTRVQYGVEASPGGSTDIPTTMWRGTGVLKDNLSVVFPTERVGILGGTNRSYIPKSGGEILLEDNATYEALCAIFNSSIVRVSPTTDASSAQIRTWTVQAADTDPISTSDLDTLVIEGGDNVGAEIARYCFGREITLTGKAGEGLAVSALYQTRALAAATFTSGLSVPAVNDILFSEGALYIDDSTGTIGTTAISQTLLDMSLKFRTGWVARDAKDSRKDFSFIKRAGHELMLDLTFEHNTNSIAEKAAWRAGTERALRLTFPGKALATTDAGATYDTFNFVIDLYGKWVTFGSLTDADGDNTVAGTFRVGYSSVAALAAKFIVVNESATLP